MRITRKSRQRTSELFRSRLMEHGRAAVPFRHARQLREHLVGQSVQALLMLGFMVALALFARSLIHLFAQHGEGLSPWYLRLSLAGILVCFVLVGRRVYHRIGEILWLRRELAVAQRKLQELRDQYRGRRRQ